MVYEKSRSEEFFVGRINLLYLFVECEHGYNLNKTQKRINAVAKNKEHKYFYLKFTNIALNKTGLRPAARLLYGLVLHMGLFSTATNVF